MPLPPQAELQWWYQYYFATERGRTGYEKYRREFAKLIWQLASPKWRFDDATFDRSAAAFDNPDHVAHGDSQLSVADSALPTASRGTTISSATRARPGDHGRRPSRSKATRTARRIRIRAPMRKVLRPLCAPPDHRWYRPQPPAGGATGVRRSCEGRERPLIERTDRRAHALVRCADVR